MQLHAVIFYGALAGAAVFAARRGGVPERVAATSMVAAAIASTLLPFDPAASYRRVEWGLVWIDLGLLAMLVGIALRADRYWPMWIAAIQLDSFALHAVRGYDPEVWALVYSRLTGLAAYPMIALLCVGTWRHHRRQRALPMA